MKYKILVLDLDGTLTNNKKEITEHTRRTLIDAQERGVKIVLASGRPTYGIVPIAEKLGVKNGTVMWCVRIAVSGMSATPGGATEIMEVVGKSESISRIKTALNKL